MPLRPGSNGSSNTVVRPLRPSSIDVHVVAELALHHARPASPSLQALLGRGLEPQVFESP